MTWSMPKKLKLMEKEKHTLYDMKYVTNIEKSEKK